MNIQVCPIRGLYRILAEGVPERCGAVISSAGPIEETKLSRIPHVFRQYEDLDRECPGQSFSREDAAAFAGFLRELEGKADTLYCCCDAGQSRSPAVAAAVLRWQGREDLPIWQDPRFHPNMLVFAMLTQALGIPVSDEDIDLRLYVNQKAFRDAVRKGRSGGPTQ